MNADGTQLCRTCGEESSYTPCKSCENEIIAAREEEMNVKVCPTCEGFIPNNETPGAYPGAISRADNKTEICSACGVAEALADFMNKPKDEDDE